VKTAATATTTTTTRSTRSTTNATETPKVHNHNNVAVFAKMKRTLAVVLKGVLIERIDVGVGSQSQVSIHCYLIYKSLD